MPPCGSLQPGQHSPVLPVPAVLAPTASLPVVPSPDGTPEWCAVVRTLLAELQHGVKRQNEVRLVWRQEVLVPGIARASLFRLQELAMAVPFGDNVSVCHTLFQLVDDVFVRLYDSIAGPATPPAAVAAEVRRVRSLAGPMVRAILREETRTDLDTHRRRACASALQVVAAQCLRRLSAPASLGAAAVVSPGSSSMDTSDNCSSSSSSSSSWYSEQDAACAELVRTAFLAPVIALLESGQRSVQTSACLATTNVLEALAPGDVAAAAPWAVPALLASMVRAHANVHYFYLAALTVVVQKGGLAACADALPVLVPRATAMLRSRAWKARQNAAILLTALGQDAHARTAMRAYQPVLVASLRAHDTEPVRAVRVALADAYTTYRELLTGAPKPVVSRAPVAPPTGAPTRQQQQRVLAQQQASTTVATAASRLRASPPATATTTCSSSTINTGSTCSSNSEGTGVVRPLPPPVPAPLLQQQPQPQQFVVPAVQEPPAQRARTALPVSGDETLRTQELLNTLLLQSILLQTQRAVQQQQQQQPLAGLDSAASAAVAVQSLLAALGATLPAPAASASAVAPLPAVLPPPPPQLVQTPPGTQPAWAHGTDLAAPAHLPPLADLLSKLSPAGA